MLSSVKRGSQSSPPLHSENAQATKSSITTKYAQSINADNDNVPKVIFRNLDFRMNDDDFFELICRFGVPKSYVLLLAG